MQTSKSTKFFYGLGFSARGIKDGVFQLFLFWFYNQVLGLDPALTGIATLLALFADAISDPLMGIISDKWESKKWGRRHPFMFASALPLGIFMWVLFMPPEGMGQMGLFWWMTIFCILVRLSLTLFLVPGLSLGAELTTDFNERTWITSSRVLFATFFSTFTILIGVLFYFVKTEKYDDGMLNAEAYPSFALFCSILMVLTILISTWGTKSTIPSLPKMTEVQKNMTLGQLGKSILKAFSMKSYNTLIGFTMIVYIAVGIGVTLTPYFIKHYFGLGELELGLLAIGSALGGIIAMFLAPFISGTIGKNIGALISTLIFSFFFSLPYNLRLLGFFPENGDPNLFTYYWIMVTIAYIFLWVAFSLAGSMMADVVDEYELVQKTRQEGLFFSSMSFAFKCTTALGAFFAGLILKFVEFPEHAKVGEVAEDTLYGLGIAGGPILFLCYLSSVVFILFYPITKEKYAEIRKSLDERSAS